MCVMALQAVTDIGWDADVSTAGARTGAAPSGEISTTARARCTAFPWDFAKPGGQGH